MKRFVLAHDLGTTGNKASLYDQEGELVGSALSSYGTEFDRHGWAEQNPEDWWRAVCHSSRQLLTAAEVAADEIACLVFSGQMMGCVPLGADGRALRNAIIWADTRAQQQERWLAQRIAPETVYQLTGHRLSASYSLCKILWLRDEEPELFAATRAFVHAKDAVVARLTGEIVTDPSDASGTNLYQLEEGRYAEAILEAAELDAHLLPKLHPSTAVVGGVLQEVADEVGLAAGTPVVIGGGDGCCAALGAGVYRAGRAYAYVGSSSWIALASEQPVYDPQARTFNWAHVVPGLYSPCGTMQAAGASYQWVRDQLGQAEVERAQREGVDSYELLNATAERSPPGARGLLFLPYLLGERSPRWNPNASGAYLGLSVRHTREDLIRATLEGVTMNLRLILRALLAQGIEADALRVIGGGGEGTFWNRLMADMFGLPVQRLRYLEAATSMGAAVIGGVAVGLYPDFGIVERMNPVTQTFAPDPAAEDTYRAHYRAFDDAYRALEPVFEQLAELA